MTSVENFQSAHSWTTADDATASFLACEGESSVINFMRTEAQKRGPNGTSRVDAIALC